jgi:hypothetical protein
MATGQRHQDRSAAFHHLAALAGAPAAVAAGRGRHLPPEPGQEPPRRARRLLQRDESELPQTFVDYEEAPREYFLNAVTTILDVHTRVSDLYSSPHDQIKEQLRLTIETIKERQESELINNPDYGLLANVADEQRISTLTGAPTPDDLDDC